MQVLQTGDFALQFDKGVNAPNGRMRGGKRGDAGDVVADGGAADGLFVVERLAAKRGIDDEADLAGLDKVDDVGSTFVNLENLITRDARGVQGSGGPTSSYQLKT